MEPVARRKRIPGLGSVDQPVVLRPGPAVDSRVVLLHPGPAVVATTTTMAAAATEAARLVEEYHPGSKVVEVVAVAMVVAMEVADTAGVEAEVLRPGNNSRRLQGTGMVVVNSSSSLLGPCRLLRPRHQAKTYHHRLLRVTSRLLHRHLPRVV